MDVRNVGHVFFYDGTDNSFPQEEAYTVVDLSAGYRIGERGLYVYGRNLTNEKYVESFQAGNLLAMVSFGDPRTFGAGVRYEFRGAARDPLRGGLFSSIQHREDNPCVSGDKRDGTDVERKETVDFPFKVHAEIT